MRRFFILLALIAVMLLPQTGAAYTVITNAAGSGNAYGPYQTGLGGEFTVVGSGGLEDLLGSYIAGKTSLLEDAFQTFCIEEAEKIHSNTPYNASLNSAAVEGGVVGGSDPVSIGTAYLYYQFATGKLIDYNYTGDRAASAAALQNAIWYLEGENGGVKNNYVVLVEGLFTKNAVTYAYDNNNGAYPVYALNLYNTAYPLAQDILVVATPIPGALWLLGSGLLGLVAVRRRRK